MAEKKYEEKDQFPTLIDGGQVDEAIVNTPPTEKGVFNTGITSTQIEQVVDLPIPTTDDEGKVLKVDAEGKWELSTDAEGTVVIANPTLAGTETDLTGLQVGAAKYKVPEGMKVLELSSSFGTLTDAQYELVSGNNCVIKYSGSLYRKMEEGGAIFYVNIIPNGVGLEFVLRCFIINEEYKTYSLEAGYYNNVSAISSLDGTESSLAGLQISNIKYKVGGGTQLYKHEITIANSVWKIIVYSLDNTPYVFSTLENIFNPLENENIIKKYMTDTTDVYDNLLPYDPYGTNNYLILPYTCTLEVRSPAEINLRFFGTGSTLTVNGTSVEITNYSQVSFNVSSGDITDTVSPL